MQDHLPLSPHKPFFVEKYLMRYVRRRERERERAVRGIATPDSRLTHFFGKRTYTVSVCETGIWRRYSRLRERERRVYNAEPTLSPQKPFFVEKISSSNTNKPYVIKRFQNQKNIRLYEGGTYR